MEWNYESQINHPAEFGDLTDYWTEDAGPYRLQVYRRDYAVQHPNGPTQRPFHWVVLKHDGERYWAASPNSGESLSLEAAKAAARTEYRRITATEQVV